MVACLLVGIFLDTWFVAGLFRPVIVASGSMAPTLLGPHRLWTCRACGREFACGLESLPLAERDAVCPYCQEPNDPAAGTDRTGQRVLVDRAAFAWRGPRRWEAVVFDCPEQSSTWCVKRVVGLPGERVAIRDGDVWIDGRIANKSLAQVRTMAVLVDDAQAGAGDPSDRAVRWRDPSGAWRREGGRFVHRPPARDRVAPSPASIDWLEYHHPARRVDAQVAGAHAAGPRTTGAPTADGPILDESPYDQSESRLLNPVGDLVLECRVRAAAAGELLLGGKLRGQPVLARLDLASGTGTLACDAQTVASFAVPPISPQRPWQLDWLLVDGRAMMAIDGCMLVEYADAKAGETHLDATAEPAIGLAIGAREADVTVERLAVRRDVYYTPPQAGRRQEYILGPDEYFLLGDNSPHSSDSRDWPGQGVSGRQIVGRVLTWPNRRP